MTPGRLLLILISANAACLALVYRLCLAPELVEKRTEICITTALGLAVVNIAAWVIARTWTLRTRRIASAVQSLARGELAVRLDANGSGELAHLARVVHALRDHMARQWATIDRQRRSFSSLVNQLREGVIVSGADGRIVLVNPEAVRMLHLHSSRLDGSFEGLAVERCVPQHDLQELLRPGGEARSAGPDGGPAPDIPDSGVWVVSELQETRLQVDGPDGTVTLLARACDVALPEVADGGSEVGAPPTGRLMVLTDVTELARTIQVKTDFASNASHELRTPLAAILAAAETLRSVGNGCEPAAVAQFLNVIERHGRRMQALVADLLNLSRLESAPARFEPGVVRPRELLVELESSFHDELVARQQHWSAEVLGDCGEIMAHADLLRVVLRNLIENAIRFTPPGGHVWVSARRADGTVEFAVADDGCGIPLEEQERVFERFYQVTRARSGPDRGTGLGLSIVRHAVAAMAGKIQLHSAPGRGTTVTIALHQPNAAVVASTSSR